MVDDPRSTSAREPRVGPRRPTATRSPAWTRTIWSLAVLAMVLDLALTWLGLSMGLVERNAIARLLIAEVGLLGAGVLLKGFALGVGYAGWRLLPSVAPDAGRLRQLVPLGLALPWWVAVGINAATILVAS